MWLLSAETPDLWSQFGPWGASLAVLAAAIGWLLRDRSRLLRTIKDGEDRERALYDRIIDQGDKLGPLIERNTRAIERAEKA